MELNRVRPGCGMSECRVYLNVQMEVLSSGIIARITPDHQNRTSSKQKHITGSSFAKKFGALEIRC